MWVFLALLSAFLYSFRRFSEKKLSHKANPFTIGWAIQAFSLPGIALLLFFVSIPDLFSLSFSFWIPLLIIWIFLYPTQAYFYYRSLKEGEVSYVLPLMSFIPIINVLSSWILLGEVPSYLGFLGISATVAGIYTLNMKQDTSFMAPVLHLYKDKPSYFMIITCACLAVGASLDKIAIQVSEPIFYSFVNTLGASIILFLIAKFTSKNFIDETKSNFKDFSILGIFQALAFSAYTIALNTGIVSYVLAFKSSAAIIGSVWGVIFLKESFNRYKFISFILITFGLGLIAFA